MHGEDYDGWATFLFREGWPLRGTARGMFEGFSEDVKVRVEGLRAGGARGGY